VAKYGGRRSKSSVPKVNPWFFCRRGKHTEITPDDGWLAAAVRMYLWWEMQLDMSADQQNLSLGRA
jgi:hypothetical protein